MTMRSRCQLAVLVGVGLVSTVRGQEPTRLDVVARHPSVSQNQQVANTIAEHLRQSGHLRNFNVDIVYQNGTAELSGSVTDQTQREEALRLAQGVPGVERVRDRLHVTGPAAPAMLHTAQAVIPAPTPLPQRDAPPGNGAAAVEPMPIFQAPAPAPYDVGDVRMPPYAWPTYAPYNNYSRVATPLLYPYNSWPFIGPCYPFPKIPLGWRSVKLEWQDGHWWYSKHSNSHDWWRLRYW